MSANSLEGLGALVGGSSQSHEAGRRHDQLGRPLYRRRDPRSVEGCADVTKAAKAAVDGINPFDVPMSGSLQDVMRQEFGKGNNLGEAAASVAGTLAGGEILGGLNAVRTFEATRAANIAKFVEQGMSPELANILQALRSMGITHRFAPHQDSGLRVRNPYRRAFGRANPFQKGWSTIR